MFLIKKDFNNANIIKKEINHVKFEIYFRILQKRLMFWKNINLHKANLLKYTKWLNISIYKFSNIC